MRRQITLAEVLDAARWAENASRYACMPGLVVAYYSGSQGIAPATVDVQPAVQDVRLDTTTGALVFEPWPVIPKVPVAFPRFGGRAVWGPLSKGDDVQLIAHDLDPSGFRATGQHAKPVLTRRNSGCHWWAYPGGLADPNGLPDPGQAICIGTPGGVLVAIDGTNVKLGSATPTTAVSTALKVDAIFTAMNTFLTALQTWSAAVAAALNSAGFPIAGPQATFVTAIGTAQAAIVPTGSQVVKCQP